jgi:hypothetical protein
LLKLLALGFGFYLTMDLFRESRYIMHLFIIILVCWLGWLSGLAFGQVGEAFTGSANFSDIELTCIANFAAFFIFTLQGKLEWSEFAARLAWTKVKKLNIYGLEVLTTCREERPECSVVMLSFHKPDWNLQFMNLMYNVYGVQSISLQCLPLKSVAVTVEVCTDTCTENQEGRCRCIVFNTKEEMTMMLAHLMPGTVKRLSDSRILLPCLRCLRNGCHGCNQGLLHVENDRLREGDSQVESPAAVCEILDLKSIHKVGTCICIPTRPNREDEWTNQLIRFLKPEDKEFRGVVIRKGRTNASSALENYKNENGECDADEQYSLASLIIVPLLTVPLISLVLTFWLKVDGLSSSMLAPRAVKGYFSINHYIFSPQRYLIRALAKSNANNTNVCQVLFFRNALQYCILESFSNVTSLICCISWMVLVALEGGANKWYQTHSMAPSEGRIIVIMVAICIALVMDGFDLKLYLQIRRMPRFRGINHTEITLLICATIVLEILCIVACSSISRVMGIKASGRWIYSAFQCLVWVKLGVGNFVRNGICGLSQDSPEYGDRTWWYATCGWSIFCSAFLLNATLAGVRAKWYF